MLERLQEELGDFAPLVFVVLGSGLGGLAEAVENPVEVPFSSLPGLPPPGVEGHDGRFLAGEIAGRSVLLQAGRYHFYEGHAPEIVVAPVRLAHGLGARTMVVTNAAGGIGRGLEPGSLMLIEDHLNLQWRSPLAGPVHPGEERFPDMSAPYDPDLLDLAERLGLEMGIPLVRGTYGAVLGPSYETPAEIEMMARMGAHAAGMSTVPEVITARALGMRVLGFSLITNLAAGRSGAPLNHQEVVEVGSRSAATLQRLVQAILASPAI